MTAQKAAYARILRRETHSPRSGTAITLAVILSLVSAWAIAETILGMLGRPALLVAPTDAGRAVAGLGRYPVAALVAGGIVLGLIGLVLVVHALSSGRRSRHILPSERSAVVVDDEVIASALARSASYAGNVSPDNVSVSVGHRSAAVDVRASSGQTVDTDGIRDAVSTQLDAYELRPRVRTRVSVGREAKVGA